MTNTPSPPDEREAIVRATVDLRFCRSCGNNTPAVSYGIPVRNDGKMTKWPLCEAHEPMAMIAGWFPITRITRDHLSEQGEGYE